METKGSSNSNRGVGERERPPSTNPDIMYQQQYQPGSANVVSYQSSNANASNSNSNVYGSGGPSLYPRIVISHKGTPTASSSPPGGPRISNPPSPIHGISRRASPPLPSSNPPPSYSSSMMGTRVPSSHSSVSIGEYVPPTIPLHASSVAIAPPNIPPIVTMDSRTDDGTSMMYGSNGNAPTSSRSYVSIGRPPVRASHVRSQTGGNAMVSMTPPTRYHRLIILHHGTQPFWVPVDQYPTRGIMALCPRCGNWAVSRIDKSTSGTGWLFSGLMCLVGLWPCACIPCCMDDCQITQHSCRVCGCLLGDSSSL